MAHGVVVLITIPLSVRYQIGHSSTLCSRNIHLLTYFTYVVVVVALQHVADLGKLLACCK